MTEPHSPRDDELRALLDDAVAGVDPRPALDRIRTRTKVTPMRNKRPWLYAALGAVAATAATITAVTVLSDNDQNRTANGPVASASPSVPSTPEPSVSDTGPTEEPSESALPVESQAVAVYYVGDTPTGPRLFREFHPMQVPADPRAVAKAALVEAVRDSARDPDYRSPWTSVDETIGLADLTPEGDTLVIDLAGDLHDRPAGMSAEEAQLAVEQLIYTVQAAFQDRAPVQFLLDGQRTDTLLGVPTSEPLAEGDPMEVQGTVWITSPQDGDPVDTMFTVEGRGAFFEATVSWQLLEDGKVVKDGFTTAEEGMTLSPYSFTVKNVPPGDYVLRVYDADMSGGEGPGEQEDTKRIHVG